MAKTTLSQAADVDASGARRSSRTVAEDGVIYRALTILARRLKAPGAFIENPQAAKDFFLLHLAAREHEIFAVAFLDNRHRVLGYQELFRGTIDGASVYPREVAKECLRRNAAAVMFAHNHPSGDATPSQKDLAITEELRRCLGMVAVRVIDHFVIGHGGCVSIVEEELKVARLAAESRKQIQATQAKKKAAARLRVKSSSRAGINARPAAEFRGGVIAALRAESDASDERAKGAAP